MERILIIKTSSLGDIVHALPVLRDIRSRFPQALIHWVAEESFADIPALHSEIAQVFSVAIRRWRRNMFSARHWREIRRFLGTLRAETYDAVLDLQGLYKSGFIAEIAHGPAFGLDRKSAREAGASWFYSHRFPVPRQQHAIDRNRQLAAQALDYPLPASWSYGLSVVGADLSLARPYVVFFHGTSRADKLWSQPSWSALIRYFGTRGCQCVLPWGNEEEHTVSTSLTLGHAHAIVPPRRTLAELARLCKGAVGVIGVDTGLTHFAAAVGTPVVGIYCGSDPALTGVRAGEAPAKNVGTKGQAPDVAQVIAAVDTLFNRSS